MKGGYYQHAPATFEERGAAAPFTTPLLWLTRVRPGVRGGLEVLVPSFADGKGVYVIPWRAVPDMVGMTVHDRFLHATIESNGGVKPRDIRLAGLKAARNGLAGPAAAKAARAAMAQDEEHKTVTHFLLLIELMRAAGLQSMDVLREAFGTPAGDAMVKRQINETARQLRLDAAELDSRLGQIAEAMSPVGLSFAPSRGRLRKRLSELAEFTESVGKWGKSDPSDAAAVGRFCADVAQETLSLGRDALKSFDKHARGVGATIRDWSDQRAEVAGLVERLEWLTDGWDVVAAAWREASAGDLQDCRIAINDIFRVLPLAPEKECGRRHADAAAEISRGHRRSVKAYEDWRSGVPDVEMIRRIEVVKARTTG